MRKGYDKIAREYQADRDLFENTKELREFTTRLPKNARVLDVGCGAGVPITRFLVESGFDVTGIDFSESMLKLARKNVPNATFIKKDMTKMDFEDNSFEGLIAFYSIFHVPRRKHFALFMSFHRVLKPEGVMLFCLGPVHWEGTDDYYGVKMFWSHYSSEKSLQLVRNAGFQITWDKHLVREEARRYAHDYWILAKNKK